MTPWTSLGDVAFLSHVEWASQVSTLSQIKHSKAIVLCHSNLVSTKTAVRNTTGHDNFGRPVSFWANEHSIGRAYRAVFEFTVSPCAETKY